MAAGAPEGESGIGTYGAARSLLRSLAELWPSIVARKPIIAAVGGGGKTSSLFALAASLADAGRAVALTTTTHIRDPRAESGRRFDDVVIDPSLSSPDGLDFDSAIETAVSSIPRLGAITVFASTIEDAGERRLVGIRRSRARSLLAANDAVLVEADGSRMLPVKAPAAHEPAMPDGADLVLGLIGLDCLGSPMDGRTVHRPELFGPVAACAPGETIGAAHLAALASSPAGLFKDAPRAAMRALVLNKVDALASRELADVLRIFGGKLPRGVDAVILYSAVSDSSRILARG